MVRNTPSWQQLSAGSDEAIQRSRVLGDDLDIAKLAADGHEEVVARYKKAKSAKGSLNKKSQRKRR